MRQVAMSIFMMLTLLWLTVSTPFVYAADKAAKQQTEQTADDSNPFSSTTEEKNEGGGAFLSEYLHEPTHTIEVGLVLKTFYKCHSSDTYFAFHPELNCPPPERIS